MTNALEQATNRIGGKVRASSPEANYMGPENGPFRCDRCEYFFGSNRSCKKVSDPVQSAGCCNLFQPGDNDQSYEPPYHPV